MNRQQLLQIAPQLSPARADRFVLPLNAAMAHFAISSPNEQACFVAQVLHESRYFESMVENLNYSPAGLLATFGHHFTQEQASQYGRIDGVHAANQEAIANIAYANRNGNGDVASGDGWRYRGRCPIQITGRLNYARCGGAIGYDLINQPELLEQPTIGCLAAAWFWSQGNPLGHSLNVLAEDGNIAAITRAINGGENGLVERMNLSKRALQYLS